MSTAQRFAWLDGLSTVAVCGLAIAVLPPEAPASAWGMAARIAAVTLVCIVAFYYNDLYNFEVPHDVGQLFVRLCRALGLPLTRLTAFGQDYAALTVLEHAAGHWRLLCLNEGPGL